ncbi:MAG TPA: acetate kinase [Chitinophagaceae bacterium]|nr:acetate kinase [Chitinophagaceae bacterium]
MKILVINAGSSSVKFRLYRMPEETQLCSGVAERIGDERSYIHFTIGDDPEVNELNVPVADHAEAVRQVVLLLCNSGHGIIRDPLEIKIIGHRVVHGGEYFSTAVEITKETKEKIRQLFSFAPLHNPVNLRCIEVTEAFFPSAKQVAVFDTAFHHQLPQVAALYALPLTYYKNDKIRVYGFHGISHKYVTRKASEYLNKPDAKLISIHLGNGCSIAAVQEGRSMDISMGFSPLSGLVMGSRVGDIDASVVLHLQTQCGLNADYVNTLLNKQSGLLGLTGHGDMREVHKAAANGDKDARFACELYAYRIKKYIGAYAAVLNGLDALIFTAGVGENDGQIREMVCSGMEFLAIDLDKKKNKMNATEINTKNAKVKILVIPTNEELEIARQSIPLN